MRSVSFSTACWPGRAVTDSISTMSEPSAFWDFSVGTYSQPGVADACLALQDHHGLDVNLLLYCCWVGASHGAIREADLKRAFEFSATWSANVVRPLREVRSWMKTTGRQSEGIPRAGCMEVRADVKAAELAAERLQQIGLESLSEPVTKQPLSADEQLEAAAINLTCYFSLMNLDRGQVSSRDLATVVAAAIPASNYDAVVVALSTVTAS